MIRNFYIPYRPTRKIDYVSLFKLYKIASFNKRTKRYDTIKYKTTKELAERMQITYAKASYFLKKINNDMNYRSYLFCGDKQIKLNNNFTNHDAVFNYKKDNRFIYLNYEEVEYLINKEVKRKDLFIRYYIYIKYYCSKNSSDFTIDQFLNHIGLSKSGKNKDSILMFNKILETDKKVKIKRYVDDKGRYRNCYTFIVN